MTPTASRRLPRAARCAAIALLLALAGIAGTCGLVRWQGNFHTVEPGLVYRSAQLSGDELLEKAREHGIRSVLNLRGENRDQTWYREELAAARLAKLQHLDYGLSATRVLTQRQMDELLEILRLAPKPVLIHCQAGADRTGLAAALYRLSQGRSRAEAEQELSLRYGHFPYAGSGTDAMDRSLAAYVPR